MLAQEILLRAKKNVFTNKSADGLTKIRGEGLDFCEIRPYETGDDVRKINFSASAKTGDLQTNVFNENKQISVLICVVLSSSLHFGSQRLKSDTIADIIALLGCSSIKQHNQTQLLFFTNGEPTLWHLNNTADVLRAIEAMQSWDLLKIQSDLKMLDRYLLQQQKSLSFIIGDFYQAHDYSLMAHKHQINALIVRDTLEELPLFASELELVSAENGRMVEANMEKKLASKYQTKLQAQDDELIAHFAKHGANVGKIYTNENTFIKLGQILR